MSTYLACMGTRPEIIKMAPIYRILKALNHRVLVLHTGQHQSVAHDLYRFFDMPPDVELNLPRRSGRIGDLTATLLASVDQVVHEAHADAVLVQGDTSSALAGALAGYFNDQPVGHVEAGLRTRTRDPFPEEKNRELIGRLAQWHFAPTPRAASNLAAEGIEPERIFVVGNTVIDAAQWVRARVDRSHNGATSDMPGALRVFLERHGRNKLVLVTAHRRESWGQPIRDIATAVAVLLQEKPDLLAVWPLHPNPAVSECVRNELDRMDSSARERLCLTEPLDYPALIALLDRCHLTLTDSGGIQEEASAMARPVLIARESTERQELLDAGGARLVGTSITRIVSSALELLNVESSYQAMQLATSPFGDGRSATRIARILAAPFCPL